MTRLRNAASLRRNLLRDFCLAASGLEEQFIRFDASGSLSFSIIAELIGGNTNKGLLWHLKDTAHHLFGDSGGAGTFKADAYLDWAIGFLFHECLQVMESAYQAQYYQPRLLMLSEKEQDGCLAVDYQSGECLVPSCTLEGVGADLQRLSWQSRNVLEMHIGRCRRALRICRFLFCAFLREYAGERLLTRFMAERQDLLRHVFGELFEDLQAAVSAAPVAAE